MNNKPGFTLVELLISICIFSVLTGAIFYALGTQLKTFRKVAAATEARQIHNAVLSRITSDIRVASAILSTSNQNKLVLKVGTDTLEFSLAKKKVKRKKNKYSAYLTDVGEVKQLTFSYPSPKSVRISTNILSTEVSRRN